MHNNILLLRVNQLFQIPFLNQYWISFITYKSVGSLKRLSLPQFVLVIPHFNRCWSSSIAPYLHSAFSPIFHRTRFIFVLLLLLSDLKFSKVNISGSFPMEGSLWLLSILVRLFYIYLSIFVYVHQFSIVRSQ